MNSAVDWVRGPGPPRSFERFPAAAMPRSLRFRGRELDCVYVGLRTNLGSPCRYRAFPSSIASVATASAATISFGGSIQVEEEAAATATACVRTGQNRVAAIRVTKVTRSLGFFDEVQLSVIVW